MIKNICEQVKLFFALSRTQHGLLDATTPAFCALLWLGAFPSMTVMEPYYHKPH